jgi:hypothetical protein
VKEYLQQVPAQEVERMMKLATGDFESDGR